MFSSPARSLFGEPLPAIRGLPHETKTRWFCHKRDLIAAIKAGLNERQRRYKRNFDSRFSNKALRDVCGYVFLTRDLGDGIYHKLSPRALAPFKVVSQNVNAQTAEVDRNDEGERGNINHCTICPPPDSAKVIDDDEENSPGIKELETATARSETDNYVKKIISDSQVPDRPASHWESR